ncbi:TIR domain-containing protein [Hymenobacter busanensis]|uniref:TIR domain-containing protein n=1 Tax=Hymenobacter busanensis TaxID=2607656 RepID=A0A7L4ZSL7_9BACT|nr:toll/interleukin-1 receptor domain-containing protein [Hymenobacter busanensis]KAA9327240.1 TIR domain-containing protein [Hymenobacter busanensis]QHJ05907.1 TIR domain-containing protein [Hymenobacter busanensis]
MGLFTEQQLLLRAQAEVGTTRTFSDTPYTRAKASINEARKIQLSAAETKIYDIFLSHSTTDSEQVLGLKLTLEDLGYSVYVDWIDDPQLDRSNVTKKTADILRERMKSCKSLFYAYSINAVNSKWMPWELGYFDGIKQKAAVLPIRASNYQNTDSYYGSEYLGLYYYIVINPDLQNQNKLWVHETSTKYIMYEGWIKYNLEPLQR